MTVLYFVVIPPPFKAVDNKITRFERDTEEDGEQPRHPVQDTKRRQLVFETPVMVVSFDCFSTAWGASNLNVTILRSQPKIFSAKCGFEFK